MLQTILNLSGMIILVGCLVAICTEALLPLFLWAAKQLRPHFRVCAEALLIVLIISAPAFADYAITITDAGYFQTVLDAQGVPSLVKIDKVFDLRTGGKTPTDTPPPVTPDDQDQPPIVKPDAAIAYEVADIAKAVADPQAAIGLSRVYKHVAGAANDGTLSTLSLWPVIKAGSTVAVSETASKDWKDARDKLGALITREQQKSGTKEALVKLLCSVQYGLQLAGDGGQKLSDGQMAKIYDATQGAIKDASR